ncbi:unnamed protein product [Boreogadus saida]
MLRRGREGVSYHSSGIEKTAVPTHVFCSCTGTLPNPSTIRPPHAPPPSLEASSSPERKLECPNWAFSGPGRITRIQPAEKKERKEESLLRPGGRTPYKLNLKPVTIERPKPPNGDSAPPTRPPTPTLDRPPPHAHHLTTLRALGQLLPNSPRVLR